MYFGKKVIISIQYEYPYSTPNIRLKTETIKTSDSSGIIYSEYFVKHKPKSII